MSVQLPDLEEKVHRAAAIQRGSRHEDEGPAELDAVLGVSGLGCIIDRIQKMLTAPRIRFGK